MSSASNLTSCGLPGIDGIPYGVHMCHFYEGSEDLAAALVPYFAAGLRNNERCIWICAEPLNAKQAKIAAQNAGLDVEAAIRKGALKILDDADWYSQAGSLTGDEMVQAWLVEESRALADGYRGLRTTGNVSFVTAETWDAFMDYEHAVNVAFDGRRIVALCTYRLGQLAGSEVLDASRRHHCTLHRPDQGWQILTANRTL
jgi:MEDS: MEthanogen/methylotroph, DcmR Sensory domain